MSGVQVTRDDAVATVTLDRPEQRNSLDTETKVALRDALAELGEDDGVRAVVLTGAGGHFCVGQDLVEHAARLEESGGGESLHTVAAHYNPITRSLATMGKPVVAAVEGNCVGAGLGFALACDLRVFSAEAKLATAFTGIGLTCDSGLSHTLPRMVGAARASELVLLGTPFTPEQAVDWGIAGRVVDAGTALESAQQLAGKLAAGPTAAYAVSKRLLAESWDRDLDASLEAEGAGQVRLGDTADHVGAVRSFLAKEKPTFHGR